MRHRSRAALLMYTVLGALVAAACGGSEAADSLGSGDGYSVLGALAEIPAAAEGDSPVLVLTGDLTTASKIIGVERPSEPHGDTVAPWVNTLTGLPQGGPDGEVAPVWIPISGLFFQRLSDIDEFDDALGWSLVDVDAFVELSAPPNTLTVVTGDLDETTLADDLEPVSDGVVSFGDGDDHQTQLDAVNAVSPIGVPMRLAADGNRIAVSPSTDVVEAWRAGPETTLADDSSLATVAGALDDAGAVSAVINDIDGGGVASIFGAVVGRGASVELIEELTSQVEGQIPSAPFDAVGIGWAVDDDGNPAITVAYHFPTGEAAAADAVESFRDLYTNGESLSNRQPIAELVTLTDVTADGPVTVVSLGVPDRSRPQVMFNMLVERDLPFISH